MPLLLTALYSKETLEAIKEEKERLTWIDSLYIAAAALVRERAGISTSKIAEEIGVTEDTVRRHLRGETKAGQLIKNAYEKLGKEGFTFSMDNKVERVKKLLEEALRELSR